MNTNVYSTTELSSLDIGQKVKKIESFNEGFTLLELMITISILAVIFAIAAPSMTSSIANQRIKSSTVTLESALEETKLESYIRRQNVTLTYDRNNGTLRSTDVSGDVINSYDFPERTELTFVPNDVNELVFTPSRQLRAANQSGFVNRVFIVCDSVINGESGKTVTINGVGGISIGTVTCS